MDFELADQADAESATEAVPGCLLDSFDLDDDTKSRVRQEVAESPPLSDETKSLVRRIWREGREAEERRRCER